MLALFLNHPPVGALITAIGRPGRMRFSLNLGEAGNPNPTIVRRSVGEVVDARPNVRAPLATRPVVR